MLLGPSLEVKKVHGIIPVVVMLLRGTCVKPGVPANERQLPGESHGFVPSRLLSCTVRSYGTPLMVHASGGVV